MRNRKILSLLLYLLTFGSVRVTAADGVHSGQQLEPFVFTTAWTAQAEFAGYYAAKELGFYQDAGLDVKILHPSITSTVYHRMSTDECNAGMFSMMPAMELIADGAPLVNIFQTSMNCSYLIVSRNGKSPLSQKGIRLAIYNSEPNYMSVIMNHRERMNYEFVKFTGNINVFLAGAVDAMAVVSYNEYYQLKQAGFDMPEQSLFRFRDHGYNIQENGVYVKRDFYESHREQVKHFAEASRRGWEWVAQHQEEALDIVMKYVRADKVPTNRVLQKLMLQEILRLQKDPDSGKREFRVRPDMVRKACRMMQECGILKREVTYDELMGK